MSTLTIDQLLVHKPPMVLLDKFIEADSESAYCKVFITPESLFYSPEQKGVPVYVGIEYMAQTIAAYSGALAQREGGDPKVGFLLGTRKYSPTQTLFTNGQELHIKATKVVQDSNGLSVFECSIAADEEENAVVQAKLNVFQPTEASTWMQENL